MKHTQIYNFNQPEMDDKVSLASIQDNIDKVDSAIKESNDTNDAIKYEDYAKTADFDADIEDIEKFKRVVNTEGFYLDKDLWNTLDYPRADKHGLLTSHAANILKEKLDSVKALKFDLDTELKAVNNGLANTTIKDNIITQPIDFSNHTATTYGNTCIIFPKAYGLNSYWVEGTSRIERIIGTKQITAVDNLRNIKYFVSNANSGYMSGTVGFEPTMTFPLLLQCAKYPHEPGLRLMVREGNNGFIRTNGKKTLYRNLGVNNVLTNATVFYISNTITTLKNDWNKNTNIDTIYISNSITTFESNCFNGISTIYYVGTKSELMHNNAFMAACSAQGIDFMTIYNNNVVASGPAGGFGAYDASTTLLITWNDLTASGFDMNEAYEDLNTWTMKCLMTFGSDDYIYYNNDTTNQIVAMSVNYKTPKSSITVNVNGNISGCAQDKKNNCWYMVVNNKVFYTTNGSDFVEVVASGFTNSNIDNVISCNGKIYAVSGTNIFIINNDNYSFSLKNSHNINVGFTIQSLLTNDIHVFIVGNTTNSNVSYYEIDEANNIVQNTVSTSHHGSGPEVPIRTADSNFIAFINGGLIIITDNFWIITNSQKQSINSYLKVLGVNSPNE